MSADRGAPVPAVRAPGLLRPVPGCAGHRLLAAGPRPVLRHARLRGQGGHQGGHPNMTCRYSCRYTVDSLYSGNADSMSNVTSGEAGPGHGIQARGDTGPGLSMSSIASNFGTTIRQFLSTRFYLNNAMRLSSGGAYSEAAPWCRSLRTSRGSGRTSPWTSSTSPRRTWRP